MYSRSLRVSLLALALLVLVAHCTHAAETSTPSAALARGGGCKVPNCERCHPYNMSQCHMCAPQYYPSATGGACVQGTCDASAANCRACRNGDSAHCLLCNDGEEPTSSGKCKCRVNNCVQCSAAGGSICLKCHPGYYRSTDSGQCVKGACTTSTVNCRACQKESPKTCVLCEDLTAPVGGKCPCTLAGCLYCDYTGLFTSCTECLPGYYKNWLGACVRGYCDDSVQYCKACKTASKCEVCTDNTNPSNGKCPCRAPNCNRCDAFNEGKCETCVPGFTNVMGACIKKGCTVDLRNCIECSELNSAMCVKCANGYVLVGNSCPKCSVSHCTTCRAGSTATCEAAGCERGYEYVDGACRAPCESPNCVSCAPSSLDGRECAVCKAGYNLHNEGPMSVCLKKGVCASQVGDCAECDADRPEVCVRCISGAVLTDGGCVRCTVRHCLRCMEGNAAMCAVGACEDGYSYVNGECKSPCNVEHCQDCVLGDASVCFACQPHYDLTNEDNATICKSNGALLQSGSGLAGLASLAVLVSVAFL